MDCYSSRAVSQNFMNELAQSDLSFLCYSSRCVTTLKIKKTQNFILIQDIVKFYGLTKSQLCLKISKEKYFMHLALYNFILQIDKKLVNFRFFWNTLSPTLTTNTGLAVNTLTTNTGLAVNTLTTNKACQI